MKISEIYENVKSPMELVIDALLQIGWTPEGHTDVQTIRMGTSASPVYGKSGGQLVTTGGRNRFNKPGTNIWVTVGKQTTAFYRKVPGKAVDFKNYSTKWELDKIKIAAKCDNTADMPKSQAAIDEEKRAKEYEIRANNERMRREKEEQDILNSGGRILRLSGLLGRMYATKNGLLCVMNDGSEITPCCWKNGVYLIDNRIGNYRASDRSHNEDCPNFEN